MSASVTSRVSAAKGAVQTDPPKAKDATPTARTRRVAPSAALEFSAKGSERLGNSRAAGGPDGTGAAMARDFRLRPAQVMTRWLTAAGIDRGESLERDLDRAGQQFGKSDNWAPHEWSFCSYPHRLRTEPVPNELSAQDVHHLRFGLLGRFQGLAHYGRELRHFGATDLQKQILELSRSKAQAMAPDYRHSERNRSRDEFISDVDALIKELEQLQPLHERLAKALKTHFQVSDLWGFEITPQQVFQLFSGEPAPQSSEQAIRSAMNAIAAAFPEYEKGFSLRQYQSGNMFLTVPQRVKEVEARMAFLERVELANPQALRGR